MSERKRVTVNEAAMQEIIANDKQEYLIKPFVKEPELLVIQEVEPEPEPKPEPEPVETTEPVKKTKEKKRSASERSDFAELFLKDNRLSDRRIVYVSKETYEKLIKYVSIITDRKLGLVGYVDNVMAHHIESYKSEINDLFESKLGCKVFKNN
jgi:hypothetical protein